MIDDLRAIAIFAETVRQGSFRGAAKVLGLSPSVVSYHISQLEKHIGNALIYRSTRKISLTHEGETLYQHALDMLDAAQLGLSKVTPDNYQPSGKLLITLPSVLSHCAISEKIASFVKQHPQIDLNVLCTDTRQNLIEEGIDLAIRAGSMEDSALKSRCIGALQRRLVCSWDYWQQATKESQSQCLDDKHLTPKDLTHWQWIKLAMLPNSRSLTGPEGETVTIEFTSQTTVNNVELMTQFCRHGLGLATPPAFLVNKDIQAGTLVEVLPDWQVEPIPLYAVWPANVSINSNAKHFLNYLTDQLPYLIDK